MKTINPPGYGFRQCIGIDVSKNELVACLCMYDPGCGAEFGHPCQTFKNNKTGFNQLVKWARKEAYKEFPLLFLMEPTGSYYEDLAHHLNKLRFTVYVVQPRRVHAFFEEEGFRTKTDYVDARGLALMGCVKSHMKPWTPPSPVYRQLRFLTRTATDIKTMRTTLLNQREAISHSFDPDKEACRELDSLIKSCDRQLDANERKLAELVNSNPEIKKKVGYVESIVGVGFLSAVTILAETDGFALMTSRKQVASFAGLDVKARQSGSFAGKTHISKAGNVHLRKALYMCAVSASMHNPQMMDLYNRMCYRGSEPRAAHTAVMRKLLTLAYTLVKRKELYDRDK